MPFEDLFEGLERILKEAETISTAGDKNAEVLGTVARLAAEIRSALMELKELGDRTEQSTEQMAALTSLASQFWALEGRVKELRNDSERLALVKHGERTCL